MAAFSLNTVRKFSKTAFRNAIQNITVIGGGSMGSGIAQVAAQAGNNVTIVETKSELLKQAEEAIQASLSRVAKKLHKNDPAAGQKFIEGIKNRIKGSTDPNQTIKDSDLVIEAISENLEVKQKLFKSLDQSAPAKTLFASNTSSLSITEIASVTNRKDKFGGLHFFNPVPMMRLVEVVKTAEISEETIQEFLSWGKLIGKTCVVCKDTPGFIVNRLLVPAGEEAFKLLERGVATAADIDTAMKLGAGWPMGPFEVADLSGLDISLAVLEGWHKKFPDNQLFVPSELHRRLVKEGKLGRKTGEGIHNYKK